MDFPRATVTPDGAAYRIAEALMSPDVKMVQAGSIIYRLATELGIGEQVNDEIRLRGDLARSDSSAATPMQVEQ